MAYNEIDPEEEKLYKEKAKKQLDKAKKDPVSSKKKPEKISKWVYFAKFLLMTVCAVTFALVLGGAVIAKATLFLMTSQLNPYRTIPYCIKTLGTTTKFIAHSSQPERISWYWALYFVFLVPQILVFFRCSRLFYYKKRNWPTFWQFILPFFFETLHTIGTGLLLYLVLPSLDIVKAAMITNALCLVPAILGTLSRAYKSSQCFAAVILILDVLAIAGQLSGLVAWPVSSINSPQISEDKTWCFPIAAILISFGWWENYVDKESYFSIIRKLGEMKKDLASTRNFTYAITSVWKTLVFLCTMTFCFLINEGNVSPLYKNFGYAFSRHNFYAEEERRTVVPINNPETPESVMNDALFKQESSPEAVLWVAFIQISAAYLCFISAKFACKICIQKISFSLPLLLTVPTAILTMISLCGMRETDTCFWADTFPGYLFWTCPSGNFSEYLATQRIWMWIFWIFSQVWVTIHIWYPRTKKLAAAEKLITTPYSYAVFPDQSLALSRRIKNKRAKRNTTVDEDNDTRKSFDNETISQTTVPSVRTRRVGSSGGVVKKPRIIACATLWHETPEEMEKMLGSIFKVDKDESREYDYETQIFFDGAFDKKMQLNNFVHDFVEKLKEIADHHNSSNIQQSKKISTPYGGKLVWVLPHGTQLTIHLKDNKKIRHKKRWSQVMYMYYLLTHKMEQDFPKYTEDQLKAVAKNTYILALDGDIDFSAKSVGYLLDLMQKDMTVGAACGRIHPTGSGPMVWYQKFEYAIGHWFQKATEHMIGCVLCSPGCFSLFRASALLDNNVMATYTTKAKKPGDFVQYDQGEDRWLCTLLLKAGHRVEYSAASDAKTQAPEGFFEFFNQRRRWITSTMANIIDLLSDRERVVKANPNISSIYIWYQYGLFIGSTLGPGTIYLMLVGASVTAFKISQWTSFLYNLIPLLIFFIVCFFCKSDTQLKVAAVLSAAYALVMVAVLVAISLQMSEDGILAPSSISVVAVASSFVIAAVLHPKEAWCLPCGLVYYVTIPSMYLLLIIYALFNMNDMGWGTRVVAEEKDSAPKDSEMKEIPEEIKRKVTLWETWMSKSRKGRNSNVCMDLSEVLCCSGPQHNDDNEQSRSLLGTEEEKVASGKITSDNNEDDQAQNETENPIWMDDEHLNETEIETLTAEEEIFWKVIIEEFLSPTSGNEKEKKKEEDMAKELVELRNKCVFGYFIINALFVLLIFLLQLEKGTIHLKWPLGQQYTVSYREGSTQMFLETEYLELEPIGLVFVAFFAVVLGIQFVMMLFHRSGTITQILARTHIDFFARPISVEEKPTLNYADNITLKEKKTNDMEMIDLSSNGETKGSCISGETAVVQDFSEGENVQSRKVLFTDEEPRFSLPILTNANAYKEYLKVGGHSLTLIDFKSLKGSNNPERKVIQYLENGRPSADKWISDKIIDSFLHQITDGQRIIYCNTASSLMIFKGENCDRIFMNDFGNDLHDWSMVERILFPVLNGNHWVLLDANISTKTITLLNSLSRRNQEFPHHYINRYINILNTQLKCNHSWNVEEPEVQQQDNYVDCGAAVCFFAECITNNGSVTQSVVFSSYRKHILQTIVGKCNPFAPQQIKDEKCNLCKSDASKSDDCIKCVRCQCYIHKSCIHGGNSFCS